MASIAIWLNKERKNKHGLCPIYFRLKVKNQPYGLILTGMAVSPQMWDDEKLQVTDSDQRAEDINFELSKKVSKIKNFIYKLEISGSLKNMNVKQLKMLVVDFLSEEKKQISFLGYLTKISSQYSKSTKLRFSGVERHFKIFSREDLLLSDIDSNCLLNFERYLKQLGLTDHTIVGYMKVIKSILNHAVEENLIFRNPFNLLSPLREPDKRPRIYRS